MKKHILKVTAILSIAILCTNQNVYAQGGSSSLINSTDANVLLNAYLGPLAKAFGASMNAGAWHRRF